MSQTQPQEGGGPSRRPGRLRRFLRGLWRFFLWYTLVSLAVSFIPEAPFEIEELSVEGVRLSGRLRAGAAKSVITPPQELWKRTNLYGEEGPILGVADDLHARALTLGVEGRPELVSLVSVEILIVPPALLPAVREELSRRGLAHVRVTLNASHTHAGPGNLWDVPFGSLYMGRYNDAFFRFLVGRVVDAVETAVKSMRPARVGFGRTRTRHLVISRRYSDPVSGVDPPVDEELQVMRLDAAEGGVIAWVLNLGAHPTSLLHFTDKHLSGEYPGAISRRLEAKHEGAVALFLQGATGSARSSSPRPYEHYKDIENKKFAKVAMQADMLETFVAEAEEGMQFESDLDLASEMIRVALPTPDAHFFPEERPWTALRILTVIPNWVFNQAADWIALPDETVFQALRVNHAYFLTYPCDLSSRLGWQIKQHVKRDHVFILGHTNDYSLGYVLSREEYDMGGLAGLGGSERVQCFYGKRAGPFCVKVTRELVERVKEKDASEVFRYRLGDHPSMLPGRPEPLVGEKR